MVMRLLRALFPQGRWDWTVPTVKQLQPPLLRQLTIWGGGGRTQLSPKADSPLCSLWAAHLHTARCPFSHSDAVSLLRYKPLPVWGETLLAAGITHATSSWGSSLLRL